MGWWILLVVVAFALGHGNLAGTGLVLVGGAGVCYWLSLHRHPFRVCRKCGGTAGMGERCSLGRTGPARHAVGRRDTAGGACSCSTPLPPPSRHGLNGLPNRRGSGEEPPVRTTAAVPRALPAEAVTAIFEHRPVTAELVHALNPERRLDDLADDLKQIGYPAR
jgi:hypothetical protein